MNRELNRLSGPDMVFQSAIGAIGLWLSGDTLIRIAYRDGCEACEAGSEAAAAVKAGIERYLRGEERFIDVPYRVDGTVFQRKVLRELLKIPYGEVRTYGEIAKRLKTSPRAVGNACRRNPLPLVIPCHRVVSASGPGGYDGARTGRLVDIKCRLLAMEGRDGAKSAWPGYRSGSGHDD